MIHKTIIYLVFLSSLFAVSCKQENTQNIEDDSDDYALVISYDQEQVSFFDYSDVKDSNKLTISDKLNMKERRFNKENWKIKIKENGACKMILTKLRDAKARHKSESITPDDDVVKVVYEDGKAYHYNANISLVHTSDNEMPNFKELITLYSQKAKGRFALAKTTLKSSGVPFEHIKVIESMIQDEALGTLREVLYLDTVANVLVKGELYDSNNKLISKDTIAYGEFAQGHFMPTTEWHSNIQTNVYNAEYTSNSITEYTNIEIINNL